MNNRTGQTKTGRKKKGRAVHGMLILNKSAGMSSNAALQQAKRLFFAAKAGHTGSLDPMATGVLPICFGETTKFSQYLLDADKQYSSTFCLGIETTTGDAEGETITTCDASNISRTQVEEAIEQFIGDIEQVPPMYSAIKHQGQPLYKLARQGKEIERKARTVSIFNFDMLDFRPGNKANTVEIECLVHCSKGTYIRSLASDLGKALGCGGHVAALHRVATSEFSEDQAISLDELRAERGEQLAEVLDHHLLPLDTPVNHLSALALPAQSSYYFAQGQAVMDAQVLKLGPTGQYIRVFDSENEFMGIGEITDDGRVTPKRLVVM